MMGRKFRRPLGGLLMVSWSHPTCADPARKWSTMHIEDIEYFIRRPAPGRASWRSTTVARRAAPGGARVPRGQRARATTPRTVARRLAELGYVAVRPRLLRRRQAAARTRRSERAQRADRRSAAAPARVGRAGLDVLLASEYADASRVAAIGYCFGGTMSLELARGGADLKAVVGFHSGLSTSAPDDAGNITGSVLVCIGTEDPFIPPEQRVAFEEEMRAGGCRLADEPLRRRRAQLHQPGGRRLQPGARLRRRRPTPGPGGRCSTSSPRRWIERSGGEAGGRAVASR